MFPSSLINPQVRKYYSLRQSRNPPLYFRTRSLIAIRVFASSHHRSSVRARWIQSTLIASSVEAHFKVILLFTLISTKCSPSLQSSNKDLVCIRRAQVKVGLRLERRYSQRLNFAISPVDGSVCQGKFGIHSIAAVCCWLKQKRDNC
jgi:hypothetical protein